MAIMVSYYYSIIHRNTEPHFTLHVFVGSQLAWSSS